MSDPRATVREAGSADAEQVGAFLRAAWDESGPSAPGFAGATPEIIDEIARPDAVRARLGGPTHHMAIAVHADEVVGFAAIRLRDRGEVELAGIVVRRAWAGRGVGTELVGLALDISRRAGATRMTVRTEIDNETAIAFYESLGFEQRSHEVERVGDTDVAVVELAQAI